MSALLDALEREANRAGRTRRALAAGAIVVTALGAAAVVAYVASWSAARSEASRAESGAVDRAPGAVDHASRPAAGAEAPQQRGAGALAPAAPASVVGLEADAPRRAVRDDAQRQPERSVGRARRDRAPSAVRRDRAARRRAATRQPAAASPATTPSPAAATTPARPVYNLELREPAFVRNRR